MLFPMATNLVTWQRSTAFLLELTTPGATHSPALQIVGEACVQVQLTGTPTGTVTVSGTSNGSTASEVLTWDGSPGYRVTTRKFTGAVELVVNQSGGSQIAAKVIGHGGDPARMVSIVRGPQHPVSVEDVTESRGRIHGQGDQAEGTHRILVPYEDAWAPRRGDLVTDDMSGEVYEVIAVGKPPGELHPSHWSCRAKVVTGKL